MITSTIPAGSSIKKAYLYWSHSNPNPDNFVTFEGQSVEADLIYGALFTNRQFYGYIAEVTDIVDDIADPTTNIFDVTDLNIDNGSDYCSSATVLGAWSLMIFYEEDSLPASTLQLYYGFDITQNAGTSFTLENFFAISPTGSKATFLSYEGDATLDGSSAGSTNPEELSITNQLGLTTVLSGDGGQTGNNAYNSTIYDGISGVNNSGVFGLDLDTYDISSFIINGDTQVTANVDVGQDLVISSAVLLKVPSNLISGTVFEDVNYLGGDGRNEINSAGIAISGATVELYDSLGTLSETAITNSTGDYAFGGMPNGTYSIRVINSSVVSNRGGGAVCVSCYPIQTFRASYDGTTLNPVINEVGGANPSGTDTGEGILLGAQSVSSIVIAFSGIGNIDFGYNFNTIVNTNFDGQGSLQQFIVNSNALGNTGLDIEANSIFDPIAGEDVSIFMIPPSGDAQGRVADTNYASGRFDIFIPNTSALSIIIDDTTSFDGRTQTAYSGNTNTGTTGLGGSTVGVSAITLPNYDNPEIQIHRNAGDVIRIAAQNTTIRNVSVYANNNAGIRSNSGSALVTNNLIGVNALGNNSGNIDYGVEVVVVK
ncbi:SdrD B-like domain-containing protein [Maribacter sp. IgM3_T14_3]|uniref:SdrD B-like domain-containing protein n=1 Tax=Maribacter sp. IgM3_T14_3 TaxID=3415140 RepID=UPI003C6F771A